VAASDDYVGSPFLPRVQHDMQAYSNVVEQEIVRELELVVHVLDQPVMC